MLRVVAPRQPSSGCAAQYPHLGFGRGAAAVRREALMTLNLISLQPLVALIAGILILLMPRLLNYIVAIYLIVIGITGLVR
jgi:hypothetical protein